MKKTFLASLILVACGFLAPSAWADTSSTITVSPLTGIFNVENAAPGGIYSSKLISVENTSSAVQNVQFSLKVITNPEALAKNLYLSVNDANGQCLWDCDFVRDLDELNSSQSEIYLGKITPGQILKYYFYLKLDEQSGNVFQNSSLSFDIILGYAGPENTPAVISSSSSSSSHQGDNDNRGGGDNDSAKKKKKSSTPTSPLQNIGNIIRQAAAAAVADVQGGSTTNDSGGEVKGSETSAVAGTSSEGCQSWPSWMWILTFVIFVLVLFSDALKNYTKTQYGWKMALSLVIVALIFWSIFDLCRSFQWFLYLVIICAIALHFAYLALLKKKIKAQK